MKNVFLLLACGLSATGLFAQTPSADYIHMLNSYVPVSPEASQIMKSMDYPVDLFTGTPKISIPVYTVTGKGISVPISVSYHAGGGIKVDDIATNVGLGFSLSAGGEITREIRGVEDEHGSYGLLANTQPVSYYAYGVGQAEFNLAMDKVARGQKDLEPDLYYFSCGNYSGKFMYDETTGKYVTTTQKPYVIDFVNHNSWTITVDDGTTYYFISKVTTATSSLCNNAAGAWSTPVTTSWKLNKIVNADRTDSIMLAYQLIPYYEYYTTGSSTTYNLLSGLGVPDRDPLNCFNQTRIGGFVELSSITSANDSVVFKPETTERQDMRYGHALAQIEVKSRAGLMKNILKFNYDYFQRPDFFGYVPDQSRNNKSLKLTSIQDFGNSLSNTNPLAYKFTYNSTALPGRLSYAQDFWGYANSNTWVLGVTPSLVPPLNYNFNGAPLSYTGSDRNPDTTKSKAGLLEKIELPTGGYTTFVYEPNTVGYASEFTTSQTIDVSQDLYGFIDLDSTSFNSEYTRTFTINQPTDPIINNSHPYGGVTANIYVEPAVQVPPGQSPAVNMTKPHFLLQGASSNHPLDPSISISLQWPMTSIHLPNGSYTMKSFVSALNQWITGGEFPDEGIRSYSFRISYKVLDTTAPHHLNYLAGGLRIKSITATDNVTGVPKTREYFYHDRITDSSYGKIAAASLNHYVEELPDFHQKILVRMGNCVMPGSNAAGSPVIYREVTEQTRSGSELHRTVNTYNTTTPFYINTFPFAPPADREGQRGLLEESLVRRHLAFSATVALQKQVNIYDFEPLSQSQPNTLFNKSAIAIKASFDSYTNGNGVGGTPVTAMPPYVTMYATPLNRVYLQSSTTTVYDVFGTVPASTTTVNYTYGDNNQMPLTTSSLNSKGELTVAKNWYASDVPPGTTQFAGNDVTAMKNSNRISQTLGSQQWNQSQLLNQQFTYSHFSGSKLLTDSVRTAEFNNALETEVKVRNYDDAVNPLTIENRGGMLRKYIWRKDKNLALATCTMPVNGAFVFTSFEYPNEYPILTEGARTPVYAFSGTYSYYLNGNLTFSGFESLSELEVYAWVNQGSFTANGIAAVNTGRTRGDWILYKVSVPAAPTVTLNGHLVMDQLVIIPAGSAFEGNVYDATGRIVAKVNDNIQTSLFEYDAYGRLTTIRDEQGNIIKSTSYQYQVAQ